jgi:chemotaxis protein CheX
VDERQLQVFINGILRYFSQCTKLPAEVGAPYLIPTRSAPAYDMTGIIGVSGNRKGCVYFTAPRAMLTAVLNDIGEPKVDDDMMLDLAGEIANTISGNARSEFGREFLISVPVVVSSALDRVRLPKTVRSFVIPITWRGHRGDLVVALE